MKSESKEYMFEKEFSHSFSVNSFIAWGENYPLQKTVVDHDHERVVAIGWQEISDQVNRQLLKQAGAAGEDGGECRDSQVSIDLHLLAKGAARDETVYEGGHTLPPVVPRQQGIGTKESLMTRSEG